MEKNLISETGKIDDMSNKVDVVIVGAGPAGSICAYMLKRAGVDCLLVDLANFPREKVCGGGLTPKAYRLLDELIPGIEYEYNPITRIKPGLGFDHKPIGEFDISREVRIVDRKDFDYTLLQHYKNEGGEFVQDVFSSFEIEADGTVMVKFKSGRLLQCKYLVGADGANSRVRKQIMGEYDGNVLCIEQRMDSKSDAIEGVLANEYKHGYYYLFPGLKGDAVGLVAEDMTVQRFRDMLNRLGIKETKIKGADIPLRHVDSGMNNVILIGDAGGFVNKLTYEGLYYAMATGRNAAKAIITGKPFREVNSNIRLRKCLEAILKKIIYNSFGMSLARCLSVCMPVIIRKLFIGVMGR